MRAEVNIWLEAIRVDPAWQGLYAAALGGVRVTARETSGRSRRVWSANESPGRSVHVWRCRSAGGEIAELQEEIASLRTRSMPVLARQAPHAHDAGSGLGPDAAGSAQAAARDDLSPARDEGRSRRVGDADPGLAAVSRPHAK